MSGTSSLSWHVLLVLLVVDAVLIGLAVLYTRGVLTDPRFWVSKERGFGEMWQYAKYIASALILFRGARRGYGPTAVLWGVLFVGLFCEDAFTIHEQLGWRLAPRLHLPPFGSMQPHQLGEIVVAAVEAGGFLLLLGVLLRTATAASRRLSAVLLVGLATLGLFGVGVDAIHSVVASPQSTLDAVLGIAEDGGEMIAASLLLWIAWLWREPRAVVITAATSLDSTRAAH